MNFMKEYMNKAIFMLTLFAGCGVAHADDSCNTDKADKGSECEIVKTYTRCDVEKQKLRNKIAELERQVKELKDRKPLEAAVVTSVETETVDVETIKHNILSIYMARDIENASSNGNTATVQTAYEPGIKYQYQFDFGLVPEVGINVKGNPMFGLGWEF